MADNLLSYLSAQVDRRGSRWIILANAGPLPFNLLGFSHGLALN
jgi:hypothetical protein